MDKGMSRSNVFILFIHLFIYCETFLKSLFKPEGADYTKVWILFELLCYCVVIVHSTGGSNPTVSSVLECDGDLNKAVK